MGSNQDINLVLLQIQLTPVGAMLPSPATILFNRHIQGPLPQINRAPTNVNNDDVHCEAL